MTQDTPTGEYTRTLEVKNRMGIHARPAAMIVRVANNYEAELWVEKDGEQVNGKSIMGLMMLAAGQGSKLKFIATGHEPSCNSLLGDLEDLFTRKFDEA
ncbi:MAG: HPr family phosphocarrier protein [Opitutales bacterium]